jgi:crotonobetainyl-CoA:carnitine CoA-transferase CaiB-like acyl-CoA transferase
MTRSQSQTVAGGPLAGIRIVDLTSVVFGPYATQNLGDMGADIVKVEAPEGDIARWIIPTQSPGMAGLFMNTNRNKRSIVLDLKKSAARDALLQLAAGADVFVHNLRPQAIAKLKLTYADLKPVNGQLIYCNAWGFGRRGPYAERPAYDDVIQAMSGIADLVHRQTGGPPALAPTIMADKTSGMFLTNAILLGLVHRLRTGEGQEIEVPMFESMVSFVMAEHLAGQVFDPPVETKTGTMGYDRVLAPHRKPSKTADGYMTVLPYTDRHWISFFAAAGRPELAQDPRFASVVERSKNVGDLYQTLAGLMPAHTNARWQEILTQADIPHVAVKSLEDLLADPHLNEVGFWRRYEHPTEGTLRTTDVPLRMSASPGDPLRRMPPRLGEQTREILAEAGLAIEAVEALLQSKAAVEAPAAASLRAAQSKARTKG